MIRRWFISLAVSFALTGFGIAAPEPDRLLVGVGSVEMDIPIGLDMWGYLPTRPATGTLDPLTARIFVFKGDGISAALVTLDLGRTFGAPQMEYIRKDVSEKAGVQTVIFTASHTHSGPYLLDAYPDGKTPDWQVKVLDAIAAEIVRAANSAFPAKLSVAHGRAEIGHNRRFPQADGRVKMLWANPTRFPTSPVDPEITLLRIDDEGGKTRGILVGCACHPVVFGPDNQLYSADFPGAMSRFVRETLPDHPVVAYVQGAAGNINPFMDKRRLEEDAVRLKDEAGQELGRAVLDALPSAQPIALGSPVLQWKIESVKLRDRRKGDQTYDAPVSVLLLGHEVCFVGLPGEPFLEFQTDLKRRASGLKASYFMGYTNGYLRYFPTIRAAAEGGYGANDAVAMTEVGAGERMMYRAYDNLYRMLGRLRSTPDK